MPWAIKMDKPFFHRPAQPAVLEKQPRRQLSWGSPYHRPDPCLSSRPFKGQRRPKECHSFLDGGQIAGRVTSVGWSPNTGPLYRLGTRDSSGRRCAKHLRIRIDGGEEIDVEGGAAAVLRPQWRNVNEWGPAREALAARAVVSPVPVAPVTGPLLETRGSVVASQIRLQGTGAGRLARYRSYRVPPEPTARRRMPTGTRCPACDSGVSHRKGANGELAKSNRHLRRLSSTVRPSNVYPSRVRISLSGFEGAALNALLRQTLQFRFRTALER